ncbi:S-type Pyocin [Izhakiella capsodis]|uniref:S-type Pyocin n=1 Tax=Izhakiella capsodis TaxID=1367852 RepID=A0A1I4VRM9_9GAMM|nr:S-type pyocin domain-containing protein [Izhakiella capsodis]SFN03823.1 S-type Pyocin [Izhakiella capsodis]
MTSATENTKKDIARIQNGEVLDKYRQENEKAAEARAKAAAESRARAEAEARAKAEAGAKAKAKARDELFAKAGVKPAPVNTSEMANAADAALGAAGAMALSQVPNGMQLSVAGSGVWTAAGETAGSLGAAIGRGIAALTASTLGPMVATASAILLSPIAGGGSDKVPGRDLDAMFALNAQLLAGPDVKIESGTGSVNLPVRGQLVNRNVELLKTGNGALPAAVQVLKAVCDEATGLDFMTVSAVTGAPSRTILINPVAVPSVPPETGNTKPVPVTPLHTATEVKPVDTITVMATPWPNGESCRTLTAS